MKQSALGLWRRLRRLKRRRTAAVRPCALDAAHPLTTFPTLSPLR